VIPWLRLQARPFTGWTTGRYLFAHLPILLVIGGAVAVRTVAVRGYPALLWGGDSYGYLDSAVRFRPHVGRPSGYSVFLWLLEPFHDFRAVVAVQAALGVAAGIMVYAVVWRTARRAFPHLLWQPALPATAAAVPVLYDGNLIQAEHMLLSDSLFTFLLVAAVTVVLWSDQPRWWTCALAGLLISFAALTRLAGLPLLALVMVTLLLRGLGWRRAVAGVVAVATACAAPIAVYMFWFDAHWGGLALTKADNVWLYGRTMAFADCRKIDPPPELEVMCPRPASDTRIADAYRHLWTGDSPFNRLPGGIYGEVGNAKAGEFASLAIRKQFGDFLGVVVRDAFRSFAPGLRDPYPTPWTESNLRFPAGEEWTDDQELLASSYGAHGRVRVVEPYAEWIRDHHEHRYLPGPALGALMAVGLVGVLLRLRPGARWGGPVLLPWSMAAALIVIPAATADFDYRYLPPAIPFACLAAALAIIPGGPFRRGPASAAARAGDSEGDSEAKVPAGVDGADDEGALTAAG
jgi:hypothetical protein